MTGKGSVGCGAAAHSLMPFLLEERHLVRAARGCMRRRSAPGVDGVTWAGYRDGFRDRLADLGNRLRSGSWQPSGLRPVSVESYTGKVFTVYVPTVEDRIVHRAMRSAVEPVLEQRMLWPWVAGYIRGRNRITALRLAAAHISAGRSWVADIDVADSSGGGSSARLVDQLGRVVADGSYLALFARAVESFPSPLVPGTGLWPVLHHLRFCPVDDVVAASGFPAVRFADNYLVFGCSRAEAKAGFGAVADALAGQGLNVSESKSRIRSPEFALVEDLLLIGG